MQQQVKSALERAIKELYGLEFDVELTRPDPEFGDIALNSALKIAGKLGMNPREVASVLAEELKKEEVVADISVDGPGFINIRFSDQDLLSAWSVEIPQVYTAQKVVSEYSDPNPFKVLHAGHLYTSIVGDAVSNLIESAGGEVHRVNFGGDVGMHVGKSMWAIVKALGGEDPEKLHDVVPEKRAEWMAEKYVEGSNAYDDDEVARKEIAEYNKRVYQLHANDDHESPFANIYWICRQWSYNYFDEFYARIGSHFEKYYPESSVAQRGLNEVRAHIQDGVFTESDSAVIFEGEKFGLHTRVFINSEGLPTYEAKDVGLILQKYDDYHFDKSLIITANEQLQYMQVVLKAVEQFAGDLALSTTHLTHGMVKLAGNVKMSSRKGNFLSAVEVLDSSNRANTELNNDSSEEVSLSAVKYSFLRSRIGGDIVYDPDESVSLQGNSGPYLQYSHARACSILSKSKVTPAKDIEMLSASERVLVLKMSEYREVLQKAVDELAPHLLCTYLYDLAQEFSRFYESSRIVGDEREAERLVLVDRYRLTLSSGLAILGISSPEKL